MRIRKVVVGLLLLLTFGTLQAAKPLVDAQWLASNLQKPHVVILDLQPTNVYSQYHVPGAVNSSYPNWRRPDANGTPQMMPPVADLEKLIGGLGIGNDTHVVLVVTGRRAGEMASATRVYWTFKALGHNKISILDGGLVAYASNKGNRIEREVNQPQKQVFKAKLNPDYLVSIDVVKASLNGGVTLVDNRSGAEYQGIMGGRGKERPGTIPGSVNLPFDWLTVNGSARFHTTENLKRIYQATGVSLEGEQISFCHTGHRTSLAWFVSHELLGNNKARLYDGSTVEWAVNSSVPIELKIELK